jgi:hypothetical protein
MTSPGGDDFYPRSEWEGLTWFSFVLYLTSKLDPAEREEMRRLLHIAARENADAVPQHEDLIALANAARFLVRGTLE